MSLAILLWLTAQALPPTLLPRTPPPPPPPSSSASPPKVSNPPAGTLATYTLKREGNDRVYRDARFVARIHPDGSVTFRDVHGSIGILLPLPLPLPHGTSTIEGAVRKMLGGRGPRPQPTGPLLELYTLPPQDVSPERPGTREVCTYRTPCFFEQLGLVRVAGTFDLTDEIMRLIGDRPYSVEKARFLAATAGFRAHLGAAHRQATLRKALDALPGVLRDVWADRARTAAERRRILYLLWADIDPGAAGGARALTEIETFIRTQLPAGSPDAYPSAELDVYGTKRDDGRRFAPYD